MNKASNIIYPDPSLFGLVTAKSVFMYPEPKVERLDLQGPSHFYELALSICLIAIGCATILGSLIQLAP
jgi:hypothetical protein